MPKAIMPDNSFGQRELLPFSDDRWARITSLLPERLPADVDWHLRLAITECCSGFLTQRAQLQRGTETLAAMRSRGKRQPAPLERYLTTLKQAADARDKVKKILDDRLGIHETLDLAIWDLESRLTPKPVTAPEPFPAFVRKVARCLREIGLNPKATGRVYEATGQPTWFQKFMAALDKNLLGSRNLLGVDCAGEQFERDPTALYAAVAKALRGYKKAGKARS
jgi:hypothetical protein